MDLEKGFTFWFAIRAHLCKFVTPRQGIIINQLSKWTLLIHFWNKKWSVRVAKKLEWGCALSNFDELCILRNILDNCLVIDGALNPGTKL